MARWSGSCHLLQPGYEVLRGRCGRCRLLRYQPKLDTRRRRSEAQRLQVTAQALGRVGRDEDAHHAQACLRSKKPGLDPVDLETDAIIPQPRRAQQAVVVRPLLTEDGGSDPAGIEDIFSGDTL